MMTTANLPPETTDATLQDLLERSWRDPCYFNDHVLCRSPYWRAQREGALALVDDRIVAVETGNGLGKRFHWPDRTSEQSKKRANEANLKT